TPHLIPDALRTISIRSRHAAADFLTSSASLSSQIGAKSHLGESAEPGNNLRHDPIKCRENCERFDKCECLDCHTCNLEREFRYRDDGQDSRILQQYDEQRYARRYHKNQHLRQNDMPDAFPTRDSETARCIDLACRNTGKTRTKNFDEICRAIEPQSECADGDSIEGYADIRTAVISDKKLNQKRR